MTNYRSLSTGELIAALEQAGRYPDTDLLRACLVRRIELAPLLAPLFRDAIDDEWDDDEDPRWYRASHPSLAARRGADTA